MSKKRKESTWFFYAIFYAKLYSNQSQLSLSAMSDKRCGMLHYCLNFLYNFLFISIKILVTNLFGGKGRLSSDSLGMNYKISVY